MVLIATTTLSIYKPWGKTRYGRAREDGPTPLPRSMKIVLATIGLVVVVAFIVMHLSGMHHH
jgi:hypothetical protein